MLPLALRLCWGPVDPSLLMDFLSLPICPIRAAWARPLREALAEQPGLGSSAWEEAKAKIFEADTEGEAQKRISQWLELERPTIGQPLPASLVKARCRLVSQWATGRAQLSKETPELNQSLLIAAGQAAELGELVEAQGGSISEPQLLRMLASVTGVGIPIQAYPCQAGGPTWVQSLAEIQSGCKRLIWMGLGTRDSETCRWTPSERLALQVVGIHLDDGSQRAKSLRNAERAGLCQVQDTLLAIALPGDEELRPHPVWLQIKAAFEVAGVKHPLQLQSEDKTLDALNLPTQSFAIQPALPPRTTWPIPAGLLADRQKSSASELEKRLSCPLAWVFTYAAQIKASPTARIPDDFRLKGSFAHQVLERVFKEGEDFQDTERAVKTVIAAFEARLPLDAAPLAQPHQIAEKQRLKKDLEHSTRALCKLIQKGGYKVVGFEVNIEGQIGDRELKGSIDCVLQDEDGQEALLDFKYGGLSKYKGKLEEGRATQLATYASARACAHGSAGKTRHPITGVAYLILSEGRVITPEGSPISGASAMEKVPGPAIREVWTNFLKALQGAEAWLRGEEAVPVRPLQSPQEWPEGADMVLKDPAKDKKDQEACRYCDYTSLCGKKELR